MDLAYSSNKSLIGAAEAIRGEKYICRECGGTVYLRINRYNRKEFYHPKIEWPCDLSHPVNNWASSIDNLVSVDEHTGIIIVTGNSIIP